MEAKTLTPDGAAGAGADADAAPKTLAAGELVWAKPKGRRRVWWPARLLAACPVDGAAARDAGVSYFGDPGAQSGPAAQVRRFADPDADGMARGSTARAFLAAIEEAHASAVAALRASLTCGCVPPPSPEVGVLVGVVNLSPAEFLAALRDAALAGSPVGLVDRTRLKSWVRAFGEGWGPGGAGHYPRRTLEELVDKIDLDVPAGEDKEDDEWLADAEDGHQALELPQKTPAQKKRRGAARMDELDAGEDENKNDSATGTGTSGKRERKRSKYLSPPYTNLGVLVLPRKAADLPKVLAASTAEYDSEALPGSIVVEEVLSSVLGLGFDVHLGSHFPKAAETFLLSFRRTKFQCPDTKSYEVHESPAAHAAGKVDVDIAAGVISSSQTILKRGKGASKRSRKQDDDGGAGSSIKRKKREKFFPAATFGCDLPITPAIPIRQVKAEDIRSQMKVGGGARGLGVRIKDEKFKPAIFKCETLSAVHEATKPGQEQMQANDGSVVNTLLAVDDTLSDKPAKENDESAAVLGAAKSGHEQQVDGFTGKTPLVADNTLSNQSPKTNDEIKFGDEERKPSVFKYPISAAIPGAPKSGQEQVQQSGLSVMKTPHATGNTLSDQSAKEHGEATKSEMNLESILVDVPISSVQMEGTDSEAKICTDDTVQSVVVDFLVTNVGADDVHVQRVGADDVPVQRVGADDVAVQCVGADDVAVQRVGADDVPVQNVGADDVPVQSVGADVPVQSVGADVRVSNEQSLMDREIAQAIDENKEHTNVEMHTVQQSYASLQAMVPEMLMKATNINGTDLIPVNHALKVDCQRGEQPNQNAKLTAGFMANHLSAEAVNGTCPDATNSAPNKKKKKKTTQLFVDPAEIIVEFTPGVIMPSREELLSAFGKFGFLIEPQTNISKNTRSARVVFAKKAEAEKAYSRAEFLGEFGPPFATLRLSNLLPIELSAPSPPCSVASRPPLTDVRKNLEKMILARHSSLKNATSADGQKPVSDKLLADMQGLLAQVDKMLNRPSTSTP